MFGVVFFHWIYFTLVQNLLPAEAARVGIEDLQRVKSLNLLTIMVDGWEDALKRSIYATVAAKLDTRPIILGLDDMSGERASVDNIKALVQSQVES